MKLEISGLFRADAVGFKADEPPSVDNPGGGLAVKALNYKKAVPALRLTSDISICGAITICEPLWFTGNNPSQEEYQERLMAYEDLNSFKVLITSDVELLRMPGEARDRIIDASDVVCGNSPYMIGVLRAFVSSDKLTLLTDPVDVDSVSIDDKEPVIFGMSQVNIQKNIDSIIDIFGLMSDTELETLFIGSASVWGLKEISEESKRLENELEKVCGRVVTNATRSEVSNTVGKAWAYVADTRYDTFCYAMVEAMLAGCHCFCGDHLIYDGRPVVRFTDAEGAVDQIFKVYSEHGLEPNPAMRQFVIDNYSLKVFREQLTEIIGGKLLGVKSR